jgi:hypothetical protein
VGLWIHAGGVSGRLPADIRHGVASAVLQKPACGKTLPRMVTAASSPAAVQQQNRPPQAKDADTAARTGLASSIAMTIRLKSRAALIGHL